MLIMMQTQSTKLTRKQQLAESFAVAELIASILAKHGYNTTGACYAGHTRGGRGVGEVSRYSQFDVRYTGKRVTLCCVWNEREHGYLTHNAAVEAEIRAAVGAL